MTAAPFCGKLTAKAKFGRITEMKVYIYDTTEKWENN